MRDATATTTTVGAMDAMGPRMFGAKWRSMGEAGGGTSSGTSAVSVPVPGTHAPARPDAAAAAGAVVNS